MYGQCPICGQKFGYDGFEDFPLCEHMSKKQAQLMRDKPVITKIMPGGRGSGKKAFPLTIQKLREKE